MRAKNQDNLICNGEYLSAERDKDEYSNEGSVAAKNTSVFGVFDGMGGEECGEIASFIAAEQACGFDFSEDAVSDMLEFCFKANGAICDYASENDIGSMGTTAAMLAFGNDKITLCNIGDSKIFRFSENVLSQVSVDHVGFSVFGKKPPLMQSLGIPPQEMIIEPFITQFDYNCGDKYLICSDGLSDMVTADEISEVLAENNPCDAVSVLLEKSLEAGGKDNITIMLFEIKKKSLFDFLKKR